MTNKRMIKNSIMFAINECYEEIKKERSGTSNSLAECFSGSGAPLRIVTLSQAIINLATAFAIVNRGKLPKNYNFDSFLGNEEQEEDDEDTERQDR